MGRRSPAHGRTPGAGRGARSALHVPGAGDRRAVLTEHGLGGELWETALAGMLLLARGQLRLTAGDARAALHDFEQLHRRDELSGLDTPAVASRALRALAHASSASTTSRARSPPRSSTRPGAGTPPASLHVRAADGGTRRGRRRRHRAAARVGRRGRRLASISRARALTDRARRSTATRRPAQRRARVAATRPRPRRPRRCPAIGEPGA